MPGSNPGGLRCYTRNPTANALFRERSSTKCSRKFRLPALVDGPLDTRHNLSTVQVRWTQCNGARERGPYRRRDGDGRSFRHPLQC